MPSPYSHQRRQTSYFSRAPPAPVPHRERERERESSVSSESSSSSQIQQGSTVKASPYLQQQAAAAAASSSSLASSTRPSGPLPPPPPRTSSHDASRKGSPAPQGPPQEVRHHRPKQHSQGFFEPTLPTANHTLNPSTIAAKAAMHVQHGQQQHHQQQHARQRSQTIPIPEASAGGGQQSRKARQPSPIVTSPLSSSNGSNANARTGPPSAGGMHQVPAAAAANAAMPRSPLPSPGFAFAESIPSPQSDREQQKPGKERSRMKIFSKPKHINVTKDKDVDKKALQSPSKTSIYSARSRLNNFNQSTTSLAESTLSGISSIYSNTNASSSTLVPDKTTGGERQRHRHYFLSRQRDKPKDPSEQYHLPLSSAASNSRPTDPNAPQSLYSFQPSSPAHAGTFNRTITGFDLRHGGKALREKKREEKAAAASSLAPPAAVPPGPTSEPKISERDHPVLPSGELASSTHAQFGPPSGGSVLSSASEVGLPLQGLTGLGLSNMTSEDAWPLLKARLLNIFEGEDIVTPIEDLNRLVSAHLQRCVARRAPNVLIEDLRDFLDTGFTSLDQTLRRLPDDRLVPKLVDMWVFVFGTVLPFLQAVFLPLDLELKGRGSIMNSHEAVEFWGALPLFTKVSTNPSITSSTSLTGSTVGPDGRPTTSGSHSTVKPHIATSQTSLGDALDVRTLVLLAYRDLVILPRHDLLLSIFSRLSLDALAGTASNAATFPDPAEPFSFSGRPGTATSSASADLNISSYTSQGSTLLTNATTSDSLGARSRATSNTSAASFGSQPPAQVTTRQPGQFAAVIPPRSAAHGGSLRGIDPTPMPGSSAAVAAPAMDSARLTSTVARMLQCVSVLAGLQAPGAIDPVSALATKGAIMPANASTMGKGALATQGVSHTSGSTKGGASLFQEANRTRGDSNLSANTTASFSTGTTSASAESADATPLANKEQSSFDVDEEEEDAEIIARKKVERLAKELKLNWLGRGRTGRNRRGLVGTKIAAGHRGVGIGAAA